MKKAASIPRATPPPPWLDVLRLGCEALGVAERCSAEIAAVAPQGRGFTLTARTGEKFFADRVIVAAGGGTSLLRPLGHKMIPFSPVLCPLKTDTESIRGLTGLRCACRAELIRRGKSVYTEEGEILFRDFGVSGILALNLSRHVLPGDTLSLDLRRSFLWKRSPRSSRRRRRCAELTPISSPAFSTGGSARR